MFLFFLIVDFLIHAPTAQFFNPISELAIPIQRAKLEIEIYPVIVESIIGKCSI